MIVPYLLTDYQIREHYFRNRPWYEPAEIANIERTVKVGPGGIRMHNSALTLTDRFRRQLDISNQAGFLARDAAGKIIHDIPDALILKDMIYGGHIIWRETANFIDELSLSYTDGSVDKIVKKAWANVNLSAYLPPGLTNVKGVLVFAKTERYAHDGKMQFITSLAGAVRYAVKYDTLPGSYNLFGFVYTQGASAEAQKYMDSVQALIPVVYNNNIPYITWDIQMIYENMVPGNFNYYFEGTLFLQGVLI